MGISQRRFLVTIGTEVKQVVAPSLKLTHEHLRIRSPHESLKALRTSKLPSETWCEQSAHHSLKSPLCSRVSSTLPSFTF